MFVVDIDKESTQYNKESHSNVEVLGVTINNNGSERHLEQTNIIKQPTYDQNTPNFSVTKQIDH
jgi:hypothetical protein